MKVLFAAPDRDLLSAYGLILAQDGYTIEKVFDGTQVLTKLSDEAFDVLVLSDDIPRIENRRIINLCREKGVSLVMLVNKKPSPEECASYKESEGYLVMPFTPKELDGAIKKVTNHEES